MTPNQALWEKGDFTRLAALMRQSGEAIVESLAIRPPLRALDLGCFDEQSLNGKVISGLSALAHAKGVKVAVLAGRIKISGQRARNFGVRLMEACAPPSIIDRVALAQARDLLREAAIRLAQCIKAGRS